MEERRKGRMEERRKGRMEERRKGRVEGESTISCSCAVREGWKEKEEEGWKNGEKEGWKNGEKEGWKNREKEGWKGSQLFLVAAVREGWKDGRYGWAIGTSKERESRLSQIENLANGDRSVRFLV